MTAVKDNLLSIKKNIPAEVTLVAVSKTKPAELIKEAYDAGQRDFGENYVQELVQKHDQLPSDIRWHFIGHLQGNKVKYIAGIVDLIHGVDTEKLLKEINKQAMKQHRVIKCLLQLHIAREETKFGLSFDECKTLLSSENLGNLKNVEICGLMAMASNTEDQELIRSEFRSVKEFQKQMLPSFPGLKILSFGMSSDYRMAIEEGSTMIRVGSSIFGERNYN